MTEADWLTADGEELLTWAWHDANRRKLRLLLCACCRARLEQEPDGRLLRCVEVAERVAEGCPGAEELRAAELAVDQVIQKAHADLGLARAAYESEGTHWCPCCAEEVESRWEDFNPRVDGDFGYRMLEEQARAERRITLAETVKRAVCVPYTHANLPGAVCALGLTGPALREIVHELFGNPFRPVRIDPSWLTWQRGTVPALARTVAEERAFERLPILADALEDAGCAERALLEHLRRPGGHLGGCWALGLLAVGP
jgi:hypothetical protein